VAFWPVRFGFAGKGLWTQLDARRRGPPVSSRSGPGYPPRSSILGGTRAAPFRDGVIHSLLRDAVKFRSAAGRPWCCDDDKAVTGFDAMRQGCRRAISVSRSSPQCGIGGTSAGSCAVPTPVSTGGTGGPRSDRDVVSRCGSLDRPFFVRNHRYKILLFYPELWA
jgi:hypothetical protein